MKGPTFSTSREKRIADWLGQVKFRRRLFGGVDENDVWQKIRELNDMYREALIAERAQQEMPPRKAKR